MFITGQQDVNDADADEQGDKAEEEEEEEEEEEVIICFHFITTTVSLADCWLKEDKLLKWQIQIFKWSGGGEGAHLDAIRKEQGGKGGLTIFSWLLSPAMGEGSTS